MSVAGVLNLKISFSFRTLSLIFGGTVVVLSNSDFLSDSSSSAETSLIVISVVVSSNGSIEFSSMVVVSVELYTVSSSTCLGVFKLIYQLYHLQT